jgi:DNA-binding NarL/FixJ family response regulator
LLETEPELDVAGVCDDLDSLLQAAEAERPGVVVTDIRMPPGNLDEGIRAAERLRETAPETGVVVLSQYLEPAYARALFEAGTERGAICSRSASTTSTSSSGRFARSPPAARRSTRRSSRPSSARTSGGSTHRCRS